MRDRPWQLPWRDQWVPHGLLDILRGCDITCRACYNAQKPRLKPLEQVREDFAVLRRHRRLDSVAIVGGEPTLHPQLCEIVRMVRAADIGVEIFSNGYGLDPPLLAELKAAGANLIFLHIDAQQQRGDLGGAVTAASLRALRAQKAAAVAAAGMEAGLAITAYADATEEISEAVAFTLASPHVDYLLVTLHRATHVMGRLSGDLGCGMYGSAAGEVGVALANEDIDRLLRERFGLLPFACLGSNRDAGDPRWLSYMVGAVLGGDRPWWSMLRASALEPAFLAICRRVRGRYPFFLPHAPGKFRMQLVLNALCGGRLAGNMGLLARSLLPGRRLRTKRLLFQCPAQVGGDGALTHCAHCPDATVVNGKLVPVCVCDLVQPGGGA